MFRVTQQQVLKTRITGQVVQQARSSINHHSVRFNSVAIERKPSTSTTEPQRFTSFTNTIKNVADLQKQQVPKPQTKRKNNNRNHTNPSSPWAKQIAAYRDTLAQITNFDDPATQPFFWEMLKKAMAQYEELKGTPDFTPHLVSLLVYALHTGLRFNRNQLTRLAKKPDYDARSFHTEINGFIKNSLRGITKDMLDDLVQLNESGAMHLLTSLKELKLESEALSLWTSSMERESLKKTFLRPKVVGVLLPMMYNSGSNFEDLQALFEESRSIQSHPHLVSGMIKTCLAAGHVQQALDLFNDLASNSSKESYPALIDVHLSFIGDCKNTGIAAIMFNKAINREMPYKFTLHVNSVKQFLENIWTEDQNFEMVYEKWNDATRFYGRNIHHGISSSLNNTFFDIFFEKYANDKAAGLLRLKEIIAVYNDIKPIDEPFFNIIISKCTVWKDKETIDTLYGAYALYNLQKTEVSRRIYLKSLGSIKNVSEEEILASWYELIQHNDAEGYKYIANADWAALRDATFASDESRVELYAKILKQYQWFCRDEGQWRRLHNIVNIYPILEPYLKNLGTLDASSVKVPQLTNMRVVEFA
ncbi:CYFA0S04e04126g1_1 [Cyberlindnera fabianii]|uniref:CYFA0S04e04126g1_1 n=1 Tax=Cyberlindnera fabianii TaxID=36022 RepID=A0A061ASI5_CYBFA|nr:Protein RMD9-like, mitochondrial [Cyberlindnera fabianii]CDR40125.1 CYFA0S04e04126g1_1 [Cyberlindnera fabianii]